MGGKNQSEPRSSKELAAIASDLYGKTDPLRSALINRSSSFLGVQPTSPVAPPAPDLFATPGYDFLKNTVEKQYGQARENAISNTAPGGGLARALALIETGRADSMIAGKSNLYDTEMNRAFSLATGTPLTTSTSALGTAGNIQAQIAMANSQQNAAAKQGVGFGVGSYLGGK